MARRPYVSNRHSDAAFSEGERGDFMAGEWVPCRSGHVTAARYDPATGALEVRFDNGGTIGYPDVGRDQALSFARAPSKGGWIHDVARAQRWPYHEV